MLLIYVNKLTNRLGYTLNLVFKDVLKIDYKIVLDTEEFRLSTLPKLSYCSHPIDNELHIKSGDLLFKTLIEFQELNTITYNHLPAFFPTYSQKSIFPFDLFSAIFYLVSRYEEYLPHKSDQHNRFDPKDSLAYNEGFLKKPLVNIWILDLKQRILNQYPEFPFPNQKFRFTLTIDIDNAFAYTHKGFFRTLFGIFRSLLEKDFEKAYDRINAVVKRSKDPFDTYDFLIETIKKYNQRVVFFILFAQYGSHDKNISPSNVYYQTLLKKLGDYAKIGIHPSYASFEKSELIESEIEKLSQVMHKPITRSRSHFIRFRIPDTYRYLIDNGITDEYSMGYPDEYGFRASICSPFNFFDVENNHETELRIHPFAIMEGTLHYYHNINDQDAFTHFKEIIDEIDAVQGSFYSIWHNETVSDYAQWKGWKSVFIDVIEYAKEIQNRKCTF